MENFNTLHHFAYGETQIIGKEYNFKITSTNLTNVTAFVDYIKSLRPEEVLETDFHIIHVFKDRYIDYISDEPGSGIGRDRITHNYRIKWEDLDLSTLEDLVTELNNKRNEEE